MGAERWSWRNEAAGFCRARKPGKLRVMHWLAGSGPADLTSGHARLAALMCADHVRERENAINNGANLCVVEEAGSLHGAEEAVHRRDAGRMANDEKS